MPELSPLPREDCAVYQYWNNQFVVWGLHVRQHTPSAVPRPKQETRLVPAAVAKTSRKPPVGKACTPIKAVDLPPASASPSTRHTSQRISSVDVAKEATVPASARM